MTATSPEQRHVGADDIIGRRRELEALRAWLAATAAGDGAARLVLCTGEPGIGKTRLAQEFAGAALSGSTAVAWGRCVETEGVPAFRPWRQVLHSLGIDPDALLAGDFESPEDRFRIFDDVTETVCAAAGTDGLVIILDDIHWADESSLILLRHLAGAVADARLLVLALFRDVGSAGATPRALLDLQRAPAVERLDLRGFDLAEVHQQLAVVVGGELEVHARTVLDVTGGNPLFVREVARAMADGTWRPDRPPHSVLDVVRARLERVSPGCRRFVQAAAIVGRDFSLVLVAATLAQPVTQCLEALDEATTAGLVATGSRDECRFVHALTRDSVEASLTTADRLELHRRVAEETAAQYSTDLSEHLTELARHWAELAPYGEATVAREWAVRAADEAVRRLAYEEGARLYTSALELDPLALTAVDRCRILVSLGRAAYFAGNLDGCLEAAGAAADSARVAQDPELLAAAALVLEAGTLPGVNAVAKQLCEEALAALGDDGDAALRARLLAQRSHLAFYDGEQERTEPLSTAALALARESGDDRALVDALHARKEACPGPHGHPERLLVATEMLALARRTNSARSAMWGELWRTEALIESGQLHLAAEELAALDVAVERVGGPVSAWHADRIAACTAQAQGRYAEAAVLGRRAFDRMYPVEPRPARGAYFTLQCTLAHHVGITSDAAMFMEHPFDPLPRFVTLGRLQRAVLLLVAGLAEDAAVSYQQAGPIPAWSLPVFHVLPGYVCGILAAGQLGRLDDLTQLLDRLEPFRGHHVSGEGVVYMGPVELALGRGEAALGLLDAAIDDFAAAAERADLAGAFGYAAEARYHLATALLSRNRADDGGHAEIVARETDRLVRTLGMAAYVDRTGELLERVGAPRFSELSPRESEVAGLVAEGLTNRQIGDRLFISERTAQNHVQHILTKLGFTRRAQIAAWSVRRGE